MSMGQQPQQGLDLGQLQQMRVQQQVGKLQNLMNLALQMFLQGKADNIPDAFTLAQQFMGYFENEIIPEFERDQASKHRPTL